jgi:hypothetical protein
VEEAKIVDMIRQAEYNTKCFAHLRQIRGKTKNGSLQFIMIPDPEDPEEDMNRKKWIPVFDQEEINDLLKHRNKKHFSQAEGTPFTIEPLKSLFGKHADTPAAKQLREGFIPDCEADEAAMEILHHMASNRFPAVDVHISPEDL